MIQFLNSSFIELAGWVILAALALNVLAGCLMLIYAAACLVRASLRRLFNLKSTDQIRDAWVDAMYKKNCL